MKVMQLSDWSIDAIELAERPKPEPGPGEVLIAMKAASLNYRDYVMCQRGYGRRSGELPLVPVSDGAGIVEAVGAGVSRVSEGDMVCPAFAQTWMSGPYPANAWSGMLGGPLDGVMQDYMVLNEAGVVRTPGHLDAVQAATLPCAALTAWNAVVTEGKVRPGDMVVVQGTGGVSLFALQFAVALGASVIVTSSSNAKMAKALELGAHEGINYAQEAEWGKLAREISGNKGVDLVVEVGGAGTLDQSLRAVRTGGTIALIGVLSGLKAELNLGPVVTGNIRLQGITVGSRDMLEEMIAFMNEHRIAPAIDDNLFEFEQVAAAIAALPSGSHFGKVCCSFE